MTYQAGERIFNAGDLADQLFFIQQGKVGLLNAEGKLFTTLSAGVSFGEQAFLSGGIRGASAQAIEEVVQPMAGRAAAPFENKGFIGLTMRQFGRVAEHHRRGAVSVERLMNRGSTPDRILQSHADKAPV